MSMISDCRGRMGGGPSPWGCECREGAVKGSEVTVSGLKAKSESGNTAPREWNSCQCASFMGRSGVK
jgi:hypothetical protein